MKEFRCRALRIRQPNSVFYVAPVTAADLAVICRPLARQAEGKAPATEPPDPMKLSDEELRKLIRSLDSAKFRTQSLDLLSEERDQPYQRFLDEKRAVEIARYLKEPGSLLPNSIILAVNVDLDEQDVVQIATNDAFEIVLPRNRESAVILDGQHRVAAFRYAEDLQSEYELLVAFLVGVPFYQQAELFAVINGKQKPVNRSIIYDLFGYAPVGKDEGQQLYEGLLAVARFCSHVSRIVNRVSESPWQSKIKMRGPGDVGVVSQAAVVDYLSNMIEPKKFTRRIKILPLLFPFFKASDAPGCAALLILYLTAIKSALPDHWKNNKSLLWKNNGVAVIMRLLHDDLLLAGSTDALMSNFAGLVKRWQKAPQGDLGDPPKAGGGGIQNELYERFRTTMFTRDELDQVASTWESQVEKLKNKGGLV